MKTLTKLTLASLATVAFSTAYANNLAGKSWAEIEAQAKKEGSVTVSIWYLQPQFRTFVKEFEQQYGIKVKIPEGTLDANINKLLAEQTLAKGKMDVIAFGADKFPGIQKTGVLAEINQMPNFPNLNHSLQAVDFGNFAVGFWGNQTGFAYDPLKISADKLPQSWQDVDAYIKANPKKFGYADPNGGGSGAAFIQRASVYISGDYNYRSEEVDPAQVAKWDSTWQWFIDNKENLTRTSSNADSLTRLNDGELDIVAAWEDHLFSLQKQGAITDRLKFYVPSFGMPGGGNVLAVAKNAPNPAASLVFVNWIASRPVQDKLAAELGSHPLDKSSGEGRTHSFSAAWNKAQTAAFTKAVVSR